MDYPHWRRFAELNPIELWSQRDTPAYRGDYKQDIPTITPFLLDGDTNPAVIVFPGGGYQNKARHESDNVALAYNKLGFSAFVLDYRVKPYAPPVPQWDAWQAIRLVRARAGEFGVSPNKIAVLGFSAGGHLAASIGVLNDGGNPDDADPIQRVSCRPDAMILCYAAINMLPLMYENAEDLSGLSGRLAAVINPAAAVGISTPPAFFWHTGDDPVVPVDNSLDMFRAMRALDIPAELHVYRHGPHGLGLAQEDEAIGTWTALSALFLRGIGF